MKKALYNIEKWFDIHIGWWFINGNKQAQYLSYLKKKYYE